MDVKDRDKEQSSAVADDASKNVVITLSPHGVTVDVSEIAIQAGVAAILAWLAAKSGVQITPESAAGLLGTIAMVGNIWRRLRGSNDVTKEVLKTLNVKDIVQ
jgi:hypothetical protein